MPDLYFAFISTCLALGCCNDADCNNGVCKNSECTCFDGWEQDDCSGIKHRMISNIKQLVSTATGCNKYKYIKKPPN